MRPHIEEKMRKVRKCLQSACLTTCVLATSIFDAFIPKSYHFIFVAKCIEIGEIRRAVCKISYRTAKAWKVTTWCDVRTRGLYNSSSTLGRSRSRVYHIWARASSTVPSVALAPEPVSAVVVVNFLSQHVYARLQPQHTIAATPLESISVSVGVFVSFEETILVSALVSVNS